MQGKTDFEKDTALAVITAELPSIKRDFDVRKNDSPNKASRHY